MNYTREMNAAFDVFQARCETIAEAIRVELVIPFCRRHRLEFRGGMGTWAFYSTRGIKTYGREEVKAMRGTRRLVAALEIEVDRNNTLGTSYVRDVDEGDYV